MDTLSPGERSERMSRVRSSGSKAEMAVRRLVHSLGYRYVLHDRRLPGTPDLVFVSRRKVIFVHGCFWHRHECPMGSRLPKSRLDFWLPKLMGNKRRDEEVQNMLTALGWRVLVVWECMVSNRRELSDALRRFLENGDTHEFG